MASLDTEERGTGQGQVCKARKSNRACFAVSGVEHAVMEIHKVRRTCYRLLDGLVRRGLNLKQNLMAILDGGRALRSSIKKYCGECALDRPEDDTESLFGTREPDRLYDSIRFRLPEVLLGADNSFAPPVFFVVIDRPT